MADTKIIDEVIQKEKKSEKAQDDIAYMQHLRLLEFLNDMVKFYGDGNLDENMRGENNER